MLPFFFALFGLLSVTIQPSETSKPGTRNYTVVNLTGRKLLFKLTTDENERVEVRSCKLADMQLCHVSMPGENFRAHFYLAPESDDRNNETKYLFHLFRDEQDVFIVNGGWTTTLSVWSCHRQWNFPSSLREYPTFRDHHRYEFMSYLCAFNWTGCGKKRKPGKYAFSPPDKIERIHDDA